MAVNFIYAVTREGLIVLETSITEGFAVLENVVASTGKTVGETFLENSAEFIHAARGAEELVHAWNERLDDLHRAWPLCYDDLHRAWPLCYEPTHIYHGFSHNAGCRAAIYGL